MISYYNWYGNTTVDGSWFHWDQSVLQPDGKAGLAHDPPKSAGTTYWPALGLYSSNDPQLVAKQCALIKAAGVDVLIGRLVGGVGGKLDTFHASHSFVVSGGYC